MPEVTALLPEFPGFAVRYDPSKNPFFEPIVVENLRLLRGTDTGQRILERIAAAAPRSRGGYPLNVNVLCVPTALTVVQSGYGVGFVGDTAVQTLVPDNVASHRPPGCPFWRASGSAAMAEDWTAASDGTGSVSRMMFNNAQCFTNLGEPCSAIVVLGHELIHSVHQLYGTTKDGPEEELWTTGIGVYEFSAWNNDEQNRLSEQMLRDDLGIARRKRYY